MLLQFAYGLLFLLNPAIQIKCLVGELFDFVTHLGFLVSEGV